VITGDDGHLRRTGEVLVDQSFHHRPLQTQDSVGLALDPDGLRLPLGITDRVPLPGEVAAQPLLARREWLARIPADAGDLGERDLGNEVEVLCVLPAEDTCAMTAVLIGEPLSSKTTRPCARRL
jgi:hypothetical protein